MQNTITLENSHGRFRVSYAALDIAMARYLPASVITLRRVINDELGWDASDVQTVSELLVILADPIQGELDLLTGTSIAL